MRKVALGIDIACLRLFTQYYRNIDNYGFVKGTKKKNKFRIDKF
jgi:hypothetical protein